MRFHEMDTMQHYQLDFVPRERRGDIARVVIAFVTTIILILLSIYAPLFHHIGIYGPIIAVLLIAVLCLYIVYRKQLNLDLVMSTEYQNLLFSQAIALGCTFCIIVRRDGTIIYVNDGLSKVFPQFSYSRARSLEGLFEQGLVRAVDRERIMGAIHSGSSDHLIFPMFDQYSEKKDYIVTVEPLPRPNGFSIVRGREYLGHRSGSEMMPDILRSTSIDKLDRLLSTTPTAHYTTDAYGRFEYVNPAFDLLFGYEAGKILETKLSLHHLIFNLGGRVVTEEYTISDFTGEATIVHRNGAHHTHVIVQHAMRDAQGKVVGSTGSIFPSAAG